MSACIVFRRSKLILDYLHVLLIALQKRKSICFISWKFIVLTDILAILSQGFKNIPTQRSFNEIIHFPLHWLKSTFSFQKSCRKSEKMILGRSFQLSTKSIFALQKSCSKSEKIIFGQFFEFLSKFSKCLTMKIF